MFFVFSSNNYEVPEYAQTHFTPQDPTVENRHSVSIQTDT